MYLIVGLGNPETDYANTRHNMGFNVINMLAQHYEINISRKKFSSEYENGLIENEKVVLIKPQTFMNSSGEAVVQFANFYKVELDKIIIVYDDMDIPAGQIKIKKNGSSGGHNGMKSIIQCLNSDEFTRIRVGIGRPDSDEDVIEYVIGAIPEEEKNILDDGVKKAESAVIEILKNGIDVAMNKYN